MSISIKQLQEAASKIPDRMNSDYVRVLLDRKLYGEEYVSYQDLMALRQDAFAYNATIEPLRTIDFRSRNLVVDGVKCRGWYYSDILVKVTVL